jgi:hypothetical protein
MKVTNRISGEHMRGQFLLRSARLMSTALSIRTYLLCQMLLAEALRS